MKKKSYDHWLAILIIGCGQLRGKKMNKSNQRLSILSSIVFLLDLEALLCWIFITAIKMQTIQISSEVSFKPTV